MCEPVDNYSTEHTHNSWMILSKFMTAKRREAMAAPEMRASEMIRSSDEVLVTVSGEIFDGSEYAFGRVAMATVVPRRDGCVKERKGVRLTSFKIL